MKLTDDLSKVTVPGKKNIYRLYGSDGMALLDIMTRYNEEAPKVSILRNVLTSGKFFSYVKK